VLFVDDIDGWPARRVRRGLTSRRSGPGPAAGPQGPGPRRRPGRCPHSVQGRSLTRCPRRRLCYGGNLGGCPDGVPHAAWGERCPGLSGGHGARACRTAPRAHGVRADARNQMGSSGTGSDRPAAVSADRGGLPGLAAPGFTQVCLCRPRHGRAPRTSRKQGRRLSPYGSATCRAPMMMAAALPAALAMGWAPCHQ
jgi:hypothetical protein